MWRCAVLAIAACGSAPPLAEPVANRAAPPGPSNDTDDDGIPDSRDACPAQPEDYDAFADEDGCPDPDNDKDGTPDDTDDCPYAPGPHDGCAVPCSATIINTDDCVLLPAVSFDADGHAAPERLDESRSSCARTRRSRASRSWA